MAKRDITGKEFYKEITFRAQKRNEEEYCFIAVNTELNYIDFFVEIFQKTHYLFELSDTSMIISLNSKDYSFKAFQYQEPISELLALCFKNANTENTNYLLAEDAKNTCFTLQKSKYRNQFSLAFEDEDENESNYDELKAWNSFKEKLQTKSNNIMKRIDLLFPVKIQTYEILKPLFLALIDLPNITYRIILLHEIEQVEALLTQLDYFQETITKQDK